MCYSIHRLILTAQKEVGYLEKKSNRNLDSKTGNAGYGNYTKYWRDVSPELQGSYWCACFISWIFMKAFGLEGAKKLLGHWPYITCQVIYEKFKAIGRCYSSPEKGDIVVFWNGSRMYHTGLVVSVSEDSFTTVEGNSSNGSSVIANGGGVVKKTYQLQSAILAGHKFLRPKYGKQIHIRNCSETIEMWQAKANKNYGSLLKKYHGALLETDGVFGPKSKAAALLIWKKLAKEKGGKCRLSSKKYGSGCRRFAGRCTLENGDDNAFVFVVKGLLAGAGFYKVKSASPKYGDKLEKYVRNYQNYYDLEIDGIVGEKTWDSLFG